MYAKFVYRRSSVLEGRSLNRAQVETIWYMLRDASSIESGNEVKHREQICSTMHALPESQLVRYNGRGRLHIWLRERAKNVCQYCNGWMKHTVAVTHMHRCRESIDISINA
jgi:hypothetical protein